MSEMENRDWLNAYMSLKQVTPGNPFIVPVGYFDDLEGRILSFQKLIEIGTNSNNSGFITPENYFEETEAVLLSRVNIQSKFTEEGFAIPAGYFNSLHEQITGRIELEEALPIPAGDFTVPAGYFDNLEEQITSRIEVEKVLAVPSEHFSVPEGYFDNLEDHIISKIAIEEILAVPAEHFTVPEGYFESLNKTILDKTVSIKDNNRGAVIRKLMASNAFKYATAACVTLLIGAGILISELTPAANTHQNSFLHKQLLNVPTDEINTYLQLNEDGGDVQQSVISEDAPVDANKLKDALKTSLDSVQ